MTTFNISGLSGLNDSYDPVTGAYTVNIASTSSSMIGAYTPLTVTGSVTGTSNGLWTSAGANGSWSDLSITSPNQQSGKVILTGENADLVINGESLKETLQSIKDALKIPGRIQQDAKLEEDFQELRQIREKYETLVKEYKEKQRVWDILKKE